MAVTAPDQFVTQRHFDAVIQRLDATDTNMALRHDAFVAEYRREQSETQATLNEIRKDQKTLLTQQSRWQGRDGVILFVLSGAMGVLCTVIAALLIAHSS